MINSRGETVACLIRKCIVNVGSKLSVTNAQVSSRIKLFRSLQQITRDSIITRRFWQKVWQIWAKPVHLGDIFDSRAKKELCRMWLCSHEDDDIHVSCITSQHEMTQLHTSTDNVTLPYLTLPYLREGCLLLADTQRWGHSMGPVRIPDRPQGR